VSHPKPLSGWPTWIVRIGFTVLLLGILIVGIGLVTLPMLSDTAWVKQSLTDMLETSAGGPIHIDTLEVHLWPSPQITLSGLTFTSETPGPYTSLRAKQVEVAFEWESLWQRQLVLTRGVIEEPELTLQVPRVTEPKEPAERRFPAIRELMIHNGRFHLLKDSASGPPVNWTWEQIQLTVDGIDPEGPTTIRLAAQSPDQDRPSTWELQGILTVIDQTDADAASDEPVNRGIPPFTVRGQVEISHRHLGQLISFLSDAPQELPQTGLHMQGEYAFTLDRDTNTLALPRFQISLDEWGFTGQGRITDMQTDSPLLMVSGTTSPIAIGRLTTLLPPAWLPADVRTFLSDRQVEGTLELLTGTAQGHLNQQDSLMVEGVVKVEEGRLLTAPGHPPVTQLSGTVAFDSHLIKFRDVLGTVAPFSIAAQEATLRIQDAGIDVSVPTFHVSEYDWTLTGNASFSQVGNASPTLAISGSAPPISIQHLAGLLPEAWMSSAIRTVLVDRQVEGNMELLTGSVKWPLNGEEPVAADGVIRLEQGHVLADSNHPPVTHLDGSFVFDSNLLRILDLQGRLASSDLIIQEATLEFKDSDIRVDLQGGGDVSAQDVVQAVHRDPRSQSLARSLADYPTIQGRIRVATHLNGSLAHPEQVRILQGNLALEQVNLYPKEARLPLTNVTGHLTFDHQRLAIQTLNGELGHSPLEVAGQWDFLTETNSSNLTVRSTLAASDLMTLFPPLSDIFSTFAGSLGTSLTLSGTAASPSYRLHVDLTDWAVASKGIFSKPAGIPGTFDATGHLPELHTVVISHSELSLPPFKLDVRGNLVMQDPPRIRIGLRTESGTGALLPEGMLLGDERLGLSTLAITLALQGQDRDWTTWTMQGAVESTNRVRMSDINGSDMGSKAFRLTWLQKDQKANADFSVKNLLIERLLPPDAPPRFTGTLTLKTSMEIDLTPPEWAQRFLNGKGDLRLRNGRILTSPVLSKILSLLNVHSVLTGKINILESGFPVEQLFGTFTVEDGILSTKDLALKSPVLAMAATGTYDISSDQFDAIAAVSPFGAYSSFLKSIPLFGTLIEGERQGLTTALFEVKGPRTDPGVTYLPLQSLTGGILGIAKFPLDVLKNVLTLPLPDRNSSSHEDPAR
jgi:hypothetical protein